MPYKSVNSLDQDQAKQLMGPDLDTSCLQMLSKDDTGKERFRRTRKHASD